MEQKDVSARGKTLPHGNQNGVRAFLCNIPEHDDMMFAPVR